jgi:hypothetical protein
VGVVRGEDAGYGADFLGTDKGTSLRSGFMDTGDVWDMESVCRMGEDG